MKRKGFTLVELLIVIVVIGILSAMMMLSSTEAVTSAKASNIVSNLRNMKTAALALYVDKLDDWESTSTATGPIFRSSTTTDNKSTVLKYMNSTNDKTDGTIGSYNGYGIATTAKGSGSSFSATKWYVYYNIQTGEDRVLEKLVGRAKSVGLVGADTAITQNAGAAATVASTKDLSTSSKVVLLQVR